LRQVRFRKSVREPRIAADLPVASRRDDKHCTDGGAQGAGERRRCGAEDRGHPDVSRQMPCRVHGGGVAVLVAADDERDRPRVRYASVELFDREGDGVAERRPGAGELGVVVGRLVECRGQDRAEIDGMVVVVMTQDAPALAAREAHANVVAAEGLPSRALGIHPAGGARLAVRGSLDRRFHADAVRALVAGAERSAVDVGPALIPRGIDDQRTGDDRERHEARERNQDATPPAHRRGSHDTPVLPA
jgi:hypothetical protein